MIADYLTRSDVATAHERAVAAPPEVVFSSLLDFDLRDAPVARALFLLRGMRPSGGLAHLERSGFVRLAEEAPHLLLLGVAGKFWRPSGGRVPLTAGEFAGFAAPGYAKAVMGFMIDSQPGGSLLRTETHVQCFGDAALVRFRRYWRVVGPFSGAIRRAVLRAVARRAEG